MLFEDSVARDDDLLLQAIRHPIRYDLKKQLFRKFEGYVEQVLSKDSKDFRHIFSKNGLIQEKPFHKEFPRKATNLDSDELYSDMNSDFVVRWIPREYARVIFPALYFSDMVEELKRERKGKVSVEFMGGVVPTAAEKEECQKRNGNGFWMRKGYWFCSCQNIDLASTTDEFGPRFFTTYNEWLRWDGKVSALEQQARLDDDDETVRRIARCKSTGFRK